MLRIEESAFCLAGFSIHELLPHDRTIIFKIYKAEASMPN